MTLPLVKAGPDTDTRTRSTCPYCGVGCGVVIESQNGQITGVRGGTNCGSCVPELQRLVRASMQPGAGATG